MSSVQVSPDSAAGPTAGTRPTMALEVVVVPVADVDRALQFYDGRLGWRLDADVSTAPDFRVVQLTPPESGCSIIFGTGVTSAEPGSVQGLHLVVADLDAARADLVARGVAVGEPFHDAGGVFHHVAGDALRRGPDPAGRSYGSFASFDDPDGNRWFLQEIQVRLPGR
jgi:catechol 2,3-dioxygenase-like lactoylglutathione lyase family enzyme